MEFKKKKLKDTITHTIRFSGETYDKICELAEENGISFNAVVNQIMDATLNNINDNIRRI